MASKSDLEVLGAWSAILGPDAGIDRRKCHRVVPMEVLSLGPPRTGTLSIREALTILGYPAPYHAASIFANVQDVGMWNEALEAKYHGKGKAFGRKEFDQVLGHCGAVTDTPCMVFWSELIEAYPEAKVLLVHRDEDKWLASCRGLVEGGLDPISRYILVYTDPFWFGRIFRFGLLWMEGWFDTLGQLSVDNVMRNAPNAYRKHYQAIREAVPEDRLLEYQLGTGWEPLCKFLGKDIPDVPFPHLNDKVALKAAFGAFAGRALKNSLINIATVAGVVICAIGLAKKMSTV